MLCFAVAFACKCKDTSFNYLDKKMYVYKHFTQYKIINFDNIVAT